MREKCNIGYWWTTKLFTLSLAIYILYFNCSKLNFIQTFKFKSKIKENYQAEYKIVQCAQVDIPVSICTLSVLELLLHKINITQFVILWLHNTSSMCIFWQFFLKHKRGAIKSVQRLLTICSSNNSHFEWILTFYSMNKNMATNQKFKLLLSSTNFLIVCFSQDFFYDETPK